MSVQYTWKIASASQYRKRLNKLNDSKANAQRHLISEKLENATCSGLDRITIEDLMDENKTELISLGYNVQSEIPCGTGHVTSHITIP